MQKKMIFTYFGHHKCATTWLSAIIQQVCLDLGLNYAVVDNPNRFNSNLESYVYNRSIDFLAYINADVYYLRNFENYIGFHVIRDPRDIVISGYFSHLYSHPTDGWPELAEHRQHLQQVSLEKGLFIEMEFDRQIFAGLKSWDYYKQNVLEIKMEELIINPYETVVKIFSFLELTDNEYSSISLLQRFIASKINTIHLRSRGVFPLHIRTKKIPIQTLLGHVYDLRFAKKAEGRSRGQENVKSHYRKGISGDWVNYFNDEHRAYFKREFNELLLTLGYEKDASW